MTQEFINHSELRNFVQIHKLRDRNSNIYFKAFVSIKTSQNEISSEVMNVRITFNDFDSLGKVSIVDEDLDPILYPTVFEAKWQCMKHKDNVFLEITDTHKRNPQIGTYVVKIAPISVSTN